MTRRGRQRSDLSELEKLANQTINPAKVTATNAIAEDHPEFLDVKKYILDHISKEKVEEKFYELYNELAGKNLSIDEKSKYIYRGLTNHIASGKAFDEEGNDIIFTKGLEGKTNFLKRLFSKSKLPGEKELNKNIKMVNEIYKLVTSNPEGYSKLTPEIMERAVYLKRANLLSPLVRILKNSGEMNEKEIGEFYKGLIKYSKENVPEIKKSIEDYISLNNQKIAAGIFLVFGISLLALTGVNITGNAIGNITPATSGIISIILIFVSLLLFFLFRRHSK